MGKLKFKPRLFIWFQILRAQQPHCTYRIFCSWGLVHFSFCFRCVIFFSLKTKNDAKTKNKFKSYSLLYYRPWTALEKMWRVSICLLTISVHRQKEDRSFWGKTDNFFKENIKNLKNRYTSPCGENLF